MHKNCQWSVRKVLWLSSDIIIHSTIKVLPSIVEKIMCFSCGKWVSSSCACLPHHDHSTLLSVYVRSSSSDRTSFDNKSASVSKKTPFRYQFAFDSCFTWIYSLMPSACRQIYFGHFLPLIFREHQKTAFHWIER